jgi:hypothetical protein
MSASERKRCKVKTKIEYMYGKNGVKMTSEHDAGVYGKCEATAIIKQLTRSISGMFGNLDHTGCPIERRRLNCRDFLNCNR